MTYSHRYYGDVHSHRILAVGGPTAGASIEPVVGIILYLFSVTVASHASTPMPWIVNLFMLGSCVLLPVSHQLALGLAIIFYVAAIFFYDSVTLMPIGGALIVYHWFCRDRRGKSIIAIGFPLVSSIPTLLNVTLPYIVTQVAVSSGLAALAVIMGNVVRHRMRYEQELYDAGEEALRRTRLLAASELHDSVAQYQSLVVMRLQDLRQDPRLPTELADEVEDLSDLAATASRELRSAMAALRDVDREFGAVGELSREDSLAEQYSQLVDVLQEAGFDPQGQLDISQPIAHQLEYEICRILSELVANMVWHGQPSHCLVDVVIDRGECRLVTANTINPDPEFRKADGGHGLKGIKERVLRLSGSCAIESQGNQWHVDIRIPISD